MTAKDIAAMDARLTESCDCSNNRAGMTEQAADIVCLKIQCQLYQARILELESIVAKQSKPVCKNNTK